MSQGSALLRPTTLGDLVLPNRVVMAPTTRCRGEVPAELHARHYARRASAGLIIAEGTWVSRRAVGFPNVPGLFTDEQVAGWRRVTELVHALGGRIMVQLWHTGANSDPSFLDGSRPAGPSAVNPDEHSGARVPTAVPRAMTSSEIAATIADYRSAAVNAVRAGFDGVEVAANGTYLIAQFLNPRLNRRTDAYRAGPRLLLDILDAIASTGCRVGVRLSPYWAAGDGQPVFPDRSPFAADEETLARHDDLVGRLDSVTYLHLRGPAAVDLDAFARYRKLFDGFLIANNGFSLGTAEAAVESGIADAVSFARHFVANPDLVTRFALDQELAVADRTLYYAGGPAGYV